MEVKDDVIELDQLEYICVFCGSIAEYNLNGQGVCESCREDLADK